MIVETENGEICFATELASSVWDFIEKYLDCYSWDEDVALSNDLAVVLEVIESDQDIAEYMARPESEREYSNIPFENVAQYVSLNDAAAIEALQRETDEELFRRAIQDYKHKFKRI